MGAWGPAWHFNHVWPIYFFPHDFGNLVFAARFANFTKIAVDPTKAINSATQRVGITDEFQQSLVILFSGRYRVIEQT